MASSSRLHFQLLRTCLRRGSLKKLLSTKTSYSCRRRLCSLQNDVVLFYSKRSTNCLCGCASFPAQDNKAYSSTSADTSTKSNYAAPYKLVEAELDTLCDNIKQKLETRRSELTDITQYYFDGKGKAFRPMLVMLMARALNVHTSSQERLFKTQKEVALVAEMIHTASLIHDDVIDASNIRRGKQTVDHIWGQRKAIVAGDYILAVASVAMARLGNPEAVYIISQYIGDLIRGEFMQLGSKEEKVARFNHYLKKTYKKTASLIANSCKAAAVFANCDEDIKEVAYNYGRDVGIAFQLTDDILDFTSCDQAMGKPTAADLKLGLATAPVLFASHKYPELDPMIMRRFSLEGDVERARELVAMSDGVHETKMLAEHHSEMAKKHLKQIAPSSSRDALHSIANMVLTRSK